MRAVTLSTARPLAIATVLAALALTLPFASPVAPAGRAGGSAPRSASGGTVRAAPTLTQWGKVPFWECPARTTELLVGVNTLTLHPGATLTVTFTVKNGGTSSCSYTAPYAAAAEPGPTTTSLHAGPCGSIGFEILDRAHRRVWPGTQVVNCPALGFAQLGPGATASGAGTWNQTRPDTTSRVPPGNYTLFVDNKHFSFPLRLARS